MKMLAGLTLAVCIAGTVHAATENIAPNSPQSMALGKWEFGGYIGSLSIDTQRAFNEGIEEQAYVIGVSADHDSQWMLSSFGAEIILYDDNAGFSQRTENNFGRESNSSSSASALLVSAATGPKLLETETLMIYGQAGLAGVLASERSISNCSNCYSETIDIEGGSFIKAGILQDIGTVSLGLTYTNYVGSNDLNNTFSVVLSSQY